MDFYDDSPGEPPAKKHKKHKKHKHKREMKQEQNSGLLSPKTSIKLKLKIGGETMGTKNVMSVVQSGSVVGTPEGKSSRKAGSDDQYETSDEERWLDALEKGNLNNYGDIGKKDPALLTARQKALLHGSQSDALLQLPSGYKTVELTDEQKRRRQEKARRRRQQANEKIENDKNQTVDKLLKKQDSKNKRVAKARGGKRSNSPRVVYRNALDRITICLPPDVTFPLSPQTASPYPETELCAVDGCRNKKTSVCSKTLVPVCSLQCYKKNLASWAAAQTSDNHS
ncbi:hypothetical protein BsWGS_22091 [Bradybaena similaris]